jgi:gamma-aminobutyric acid type B receptor
MLFNPAKGVDVFGRNQTTLDEEFFAYFNHTEPEGSSFRILTYDSVWVAALALNCTVEALEKSGKLLGQSLKL